MWQGMLTGFVVGAFGGISGLAGGFAAAGMSIVMDHVNGKKAGWDTLGRALGIGVFAGLFAVGSNAMSSTVSFKEGILVEWISNLTFASLFTLGNIAFDLTVRKLKKNYGK